MSSRDAILDDVLAIYDFWLSKMAEVAVDASADLRWLDKPEAAKVIREIFNTDEKRGALKSFAEELIRGICISHLTMIDGGTKASDSGSIGMVDGSGKRIAGGLHGDFVGRLLESGRIV